MVSRWIVAGMLGGLVAGQASCDVVLYSQPVEPSGLNIGWGFYSSSQARPRRNFKHADDFVLSQASEVRRVRWWGINEGPSSNALENYDQFTIEFFTSVPGPGGSLVGSLIHSETFATALTDPVPTGRTNPLNGEPEIVQEVALAAPVGLPGATPLWLAVSARAINGAGDAWAWRDGTLVNGYSNIYSYAAGTWTGFQDTDSGFELIGVPAPATALVVLVAPLTGRRSRSRRGGWASRPSRAPHADRLSPAASAGTPRATGPSRA